MAEVEEPKYEPIPKDASPIPAPTIGANLPVQNIGDAVARLTDLQDAFMLEIQGSSRWIEIILYILKLLSYLFTRLPSKTTEDELNLMKNQQMIDECVEHIVRLAERKHRGPPQRPGIKNG